MEIADHAIRISGWNVRTYGGWRKLAAGLTPASYRSRLTAIVKMLDQDGVIPGDVGRPRIQSTHTTSSGTVVAVVGRGRALENRIMLKLALNAAAAQSLERNAMALLRLQSSPKTREFRNFAPRMIGCPDFDLQPFYVESYIPGKPVGFRVRPASRMRAIADAATSAILLMHSATAYRETVDDSLFQKLVGDDVGVLRAMSREWPHSNHWDRRLVELEQTLHGLLMGRSVTLSWTHGDFWCGNLMVDRFGDLTGIVDWDRSRIGDIALVDIFHLLIYTRRLQLRTKPGEEIATYLIPWRLVPEDRRIVETALERLDMPADRDFLLACSLLYWLRFASTNVARYAALQTNENWLDKNVYLVLEQCLR